MRIPKEVVDDILAKAKIEDVIGHYIQVMKKGSGYVAYCPFHDDHDPSLHISPSKQIFKCFSCPSEEGSAGNVFRFVEKYKHLDYYHAVKTVADLIGYKYDFGDDGQPVFQETISHTLTREASNYCQFILNTKEALPYKNYLHERKITDEIIEKYGIGYNPGGDKLYAYLKNKGYNDQDIIQANLARLTSEGIRDIFYNRITIPICDVDGHPIGFTARSIEPNNPSKYINTADTPIFHKSDVVFNLHRAKEACREKKFIIIAEGPMDVIAFDRAGMQNAVCSMGTSTTTAQLKMIMRFSTNLVLAYDGDKAGQGAIVRTGKMAVDMGFNVSVINNDTQYDPDEIINRYGAKQLVEMVSKPKTWIEFILDYYRSQLDLNNYSDRRRYVDSVLPFINRISDNFDRENYLRRLAELSGFDYSLIKGTQPQQTPQPENPVQRFVPVKRSSNPGMDNARKTLIKQMLISNRAVTIYKDELMDMMDDTYNNLAKLIIDYVNQNQQIKVNEFIGTVDNVYASIIYEVMESEMYRNEFDEELVRDSIITIKMGKLKQEINELEKSAKQYRDGYVQARILAETNDKKKKLSELKQLKSKRTRRSS